MHDGVSERILARDRSEGCSRESSGGSRVLIPRAPAQSHTTTFTELLILSGSIRDWTPADHRRRLLCLPTARQGSRPVDYCRRLRHQRQPGADAN